MHAFSVVSLMLIRVFAVTQAGSYLTLGTDECFERVSIGKRLNSSDVTKTISTSTIKHCSNECERMLCNTYSYGVNGNGIGTCLLGLDLPKYRPYDDPEYDLFMKILQCRDRTMCFIKLVGGRRLVDKHIQRTLPVESKGDCELYCEYEKEFHCAGFNFKYDMKLDSYSSCQLTSVPSQKLDLSLDFQSELDYDFYEKNVNASPSCRYLEFPKLYAGQIRKWDVTGNGQDISLWQDVNPPLWYQKNDIAYGNEPVYYDRSILQSTPSVPMSITPNVQIPNDGASPTFPTGTRPAIMSPNECFIKVRTGHHLQTENIVKSTNAQSLYGCEIICANEQTFTCNVFSYRYSFTSSTDNCHLGDKMIGRLDVFQDLVPDRDSDVFARNELSQPGCQPVKNWDTDCFERVRSGLTFEVSIIKFSVQTENVHECELICLHVKHFTCRVFSFRRGSPAATGNRLDNCYLTDYPVIDMDPAKHFVVDSGCDIYNRGSYGRGCELDQVLPTSGWPPVTQTPTVLTTYRPDYGVPPPLSPSPSLYGPKYGPTTFTPLQFFPVTPSSSPWSSSIPPRHYPVRPPSSTYYPETSTRPPTGVYVPSQPPTIFFQIPGEYTPVSITPINRESGLQDGTFNDLFGPYTGGGGLNPTQAPFHGTAKKLCYISFGNTARLLPTAVKKTMNVVSEYQCKTECDKARESQTFRCSTLSYFDGYCELSDIEMRDMKPNQDFSLDSRFLMFTWDFDEVRCYSSPSAKSPPANDLPGGLEWTWMRFTVNGQPCSSGSYCTQNANLGIWSCPVSPGDWDYCCRPDHRCGYSEGINYPWCYVGNSVEQWRPCSDRYFPSTDGQPLTWPVTYIHNTGPPINPVTNLPVPSGPSLPPHRTDNNNNSNDTRSIVEHAQSLVDQFLSLFSSSSNSETPTNKTTDGTAEATNHHVTTDFPGFRVVDVTDRSQTIKNRAKQNFVGNPYSYYGVSDRFRNKITKRKPYV